MDRNKLNKDYEYCQKVIKQHSKSFYYAFKELPAEDANAVYAVYAFCRFADDVVDEAESIEQSISGLNRLKEDLKRFAAGAEINHPMWRALRDVHTRYSLDLEMFTWQLAGQEQDINFRQPDTLADLIDYSVKVAGSVGRMLLPILARHPNEAMKKEAEQLGVAMQITNILRDVGEDYREHQRIYIPVEVVEKYGCARAIEEGKANSAFIEMWEYLACYAEDIYDKFYHSIKYYNKEGQLPLLLSAMVYRAILDEVRANQYDCLTCRNKVSLANKLMIRNRAVTYLSGLQKGETL
ncbi:phytoene/squalene synthase family protein [Macrococcus equipercicus]|uniref:4,4'-diapophytoene synthase n=1 Tax=Macrococcus equipercicus TaxID=69967 RepID=A0A9Q9BLU4_9STAP|nr:phytoene/squalene synthase family protein [Macrococcus equipercicus]KAA1039593.1 phytoene/squalene synthase family protein [Macrococcus equipercicus]UTH13923.1 phytoene/squalene synthase family protein [Macrococcus equipercicus]